MSLIYFHRFLIFCAILFGAFFAWSLWQRHQAHANTTELYGAIGAAVVTLGLITYLPTVKGRGDRGRPNPSREQ